MSSNSEDDLFDNLDLSSLADMLFNMSGIELEIINVILAIIISLPLNINQQNSVGNFFEALGQNILLINAQEITRESKTSNPTNITLGELNQKVDELKYQLAKLIKKIEG